MGPGGRGSGISGAQGGAHLVLALLGEEVLADGVLVGEQPERLLDLVLELHHLRPTPAELSPCYSHGWGVFILLFGYTVCKTGVQLIGDWLRMHVVRTMDLPRRCSGP